MPSASSDHHPGAILIRMDNKSGVIATYGQVFRNGDLVVVAGFQFLKAGYPKPTLVGIVLTLEFAGRLGSSK